jgi:hypothetical protein
VSPTHRCAAADGQAGQLGRPLVPEREVPLPRRVGLEPGSLAREEARPAGSVAVTSVGVGSHVLEEYGLHIRVGEGLAEHALEDVGLEVAVEAVVAHVAVAHVDVELGDVDGEARGLGDLGDGCAKKGLKRGLEEPECEQFTK